MAGFDWSIKTWADVAALATMIGGAGIILAFLQLRHQSDVARSTFENLFVVQYQQLIQRLPIMALLGKELNNDDRKTYLQEFYHYVDLCNTQPSFPAESIRCHMERVGRRNTGEFPKARTETRLVVYRREVSRRVH